MISKIINDAQNDEKVKVILIHGGKFFSSGNDLSVLTNMLGKTKEEIKAASIDGIFNNMNPYLNALDNSVKPVVAVVRGMCLGIQFTMLTLADFIYCAPDAVFQTPFMKSFQSPEGTSTLNFPLQMGKRLASEVLLLDRPLTAKEAVECGFANSIIPELQNEPEWFDINKVPAIPKLLETDYRTLINCKRVLNFAKDNQKTQEVIKEEGIQLSNAWVDEEFAPKLASYMMSLMEKREGKAKL